MHARPVADWPLAAAELQVYTEEYTRRLLCVWKAVMERDSEELMSKRASLCSENEVWIQWYHHPGRHRPTSELLASGS